MNLVYIYGLEVDKANNVLVTMTLPHLIVPRPTSLSDVKRAVEDVPKIRRMDVKIVLNLNGA